MDKLEYERELLNKGYKYIAGVDEVGRGPLAGPVVCASVIMPLDDVIEGVDDSKKLSEKKREKLSKMIMEKAISYCIYEISEKEIDQINILQAVKKCMVGAVKGLKVKADITIVDGLDTNLPINAKYLVKGDSLSYSVGCASIIAKVYRDNLMKEYSKIYPEYEFDKNKGYGTKSHIDKIKEIGPCEIHRATFIKNFWAK
ncbi:MAG: ribonuclease HII [Clostridia bacterium]|nr:ribonuclease HII [Clostridia bacterium]